MNEIAPLNQPPAEDNDNTDSDASSDDAGALVPFAGETEIEAAGIGETLRDVGSRLPAYARLSQGLVAAGFLSANQQADILGPLGYGPLARVARFVPLLNQLTRVLSLVGAIRFALTQLDPEVAEEHLAHVGLTRAQVEADFQATRGLAERIAASGSQQAAHAFEAGKEQVARLAEAGGPVASKALEDGARAAGKLTGKGLRAFRQWQAKSNQHKD
ncbi:MAG TPA: hypothetical protein VFI42_02255 [Thermomicrobiaceae bacterium]|nr:hypothetical protein [Thermomicrobiaceae bacterium]